MRRDTVAALFDLPVEARRRLAAEDPAQVVRRIYEGTNGFGRRGRGPNGRTLRDTTSLVYGEITPAGVTQLIDAVRLSAADTFIDLGSGVGKVVLQAAMMVPGARCTGVEIDGERHTNATLALLLAELLELVGTGQCGLRHDSILSTDLTGATVLFANSTCFSELLLYRLACRIVRLDRPVTFASFRALKPNRPRRLRLVNTQSCETSWRSEVDLYVYRFEP